MTPEEYADYLREQLDWAFAQATEDTLNWTVKAMRQHVPPRRHKTRQAVQWRKLPAPETDLRYEIALRFSERYHTSGTETERIIETAWDQVRPQVGPRFQKFLQARLRQMG